MLIKTGLFITFCVVSVVIIACSDEFIINTSESENIVLTSDIGQVESIDIVLGYRDSIPIMYVRMWEEKLNFDKVEGIDDVLDSLQSRIRRFRLSWPQANGANSYEVRIAMSPINEENWLLGQKLRLVNLTVENGIVSADALLDPKPKVKSGKCIGCGDCQKNCPVNAIIITRGKAVIDYNKCIECGKCYQSCDYNSIDGSFVGTEYYLAIRGINRNNEYAEKIFCTPNAYKMQYTTLSSISYKKQLELEFDYEGTTYLLNTTPMGSRGGCYGICDTGCFIINSKSEICKPFEDGIIPIKREAVWEKGVTVCPVDAIYSVGNDSLLIAEHSTVARAIFIDKEKCINCGRCAIQCYGDGKFGSVTTEVLQVASRFLKENG